MANQSYPIWSMVTITSIIGIHRKYLDDLKADIEDEVEDMFILIKSIL